MHRISCDVVDVLLYLAFGGKEKNTGWKFLNNYINKRKNTAKNQLYKIVAYNIK